MKKICFVTTVSATIKAFIIPTLKELIKNGGYEVTVICDNDDSLLALLPDGVRYIPVKMERGVSLSAFRAISELKKIFKREGFDYIQYSTPNAALYSSIAAKKAKCPIRLYGQWGIRYVGMSGVKRKIFKFLEKMTCKKSTHIRSVSNLNMKFGIDEGLYPESKVKVIGNGGTVGVDLEVFDISAKDQLRLQVREKYKLDNDAYVFGFVGRLGRDKGSEELLDAFRRISAIHSNAYLYLVGPDETSKELSEELVTWAKKSQNVIFTGSFPKSELPAFYANFDCYVHPTYREGFGMVLQEAGAMGNAIITTNVPGASEVMVEGESCLFVKPKDADALFYAMNDLISNKEKTLKIGDEAYRRTKTLYETGLMVKYILEDIDQVMGD